MLPIGHIFRGEVPLRLGSQEPVDLRLLHPDQSIDERVAELLAEKRTGLERLQRFHQIRRK